MKVMITTIRGAWDTQSPPTEVLTFPDVDYIKQEHGGITISNGGGSSHHPRVIEIKVWP